jgi:hypothetical protein
MPSLSSYATINDNNLTGSSISYNQVSHSDVSNNILNGSICSINYNILNTLSRIIGNNLTGGLGNGSLINFNILNGGSRIGSNVLTISGDTTQIGGNILSSSSTVDGAILNNSSVLNNNLFLSEIDLSASGTLSGKLLTQLYMKNSTINIDISGATDIYLDCTKEIFTRNDLTVRLKYYNTGDTPTIVNVDN